MGKKKTPRQWTVHLEPVYRRDRDERIAKVFALVLPIIQSKPTLSEDGQATCREIARNYKATCCEERVRADRGSQSADRRMGKLL